MQNQQDYHYGIIKGIKQTNTISSGIIKGISQNKTIEQGILEGTGNFINEYMLSLVKSITDELSNKFPKTQKDYYIYTRYDYKSRMLKIFVRLNEETAINPRPYYLYFLLLINEEYPEKAPLIQCLTELNYPPLNDFRNFQKVIFPKWKSNSSLVSLIKTIPSYLNCYENSLQNKILEINGEYIREYIYSINDFIYCKDNIVKRIQIITKTNYNQIYLEKRYLVITPLHILILYSCDKKFKNFCKLIFYADITSIKKVTRLPIPDNDPEFLFKEKALLKLNWEENAQNTYQNTLVVNQLENSQIISDIMVRKNRLLNNFNIIISKESDFSIEKIKKIISVKEEYLKMSNDQYTFTYVLELYQKIIEMSSNKNNEEFMLYLQNNKELLLKFDKLMREKGNS